MLGLPQTRTFGRRAHCQASAATVAVWHTGAIPRLATPRPHPFELRDGNLVLVMWHIVDVALYDFNAQALLTGAASTCWECASILKPAEQLQARLSES